MNAICKPADLDELQVAQKSLPCQAAITYASSSYTPKEVLFQRIISQYHDGSSDLSGYEEGEAYGEGLGEAIKGASDRRKVKNSRRQPLIAKVKTLRASGKKADAKKAQRIAKHNLGRKKYNKQLNKEKERLKTLVNTALNDMILRRPEKIKEIVVEDLTHLIVCFVAVYCATTFTAAAQCLSANAMPQWSRCSLGIRRNLAS